MDGLLGTYAECEGTDEKVERLYREWLEWSKKLEWDFTPTFPFTQSEVEYLASDVLDGLFAWTRESRVQTIFEWLCIHGWLKSAQWVVQRFPDRDLTISARAIFRLVSLNGELDVLKWLYQKYNITLDYKTLYWANEYGQFHVVRWLLEQDKNVSRRTLCEVHLSATCEGDLEMVQWLYKRYGADLFHRQYLDDAILNATCYDHLELFKWLDENYRFRTPIGFLFIYACSYDSLKIAQYLFQTYPFLNNRRTLYKAHQTATNRVRKWLPYRLNPLLRIAQVSLIVVALASVFYKYSKVRPK